MNKKNLFIVSALVIALIVVFSLFFPPADKSGSEGTVGKVDKYRNSKTGQDIVLYRTGFLQDTASLKAVINLLVINETVIGKLPKEFKEWETALKPTIAKDKKLEIQFNKLNELGVYLTNNLTTIKSTRELLTKYYTKDTLDMKIDVQNNLIQFDAFITNLDEKSRVLDTLFVNLDGMIDIDKLKKLTSTKEEAEKLKEIREKMLGSMVMYAITCGIQTTLNTVLCSEVKFLPIFNQQLGNMNPYSKQADNQLNTILNKDLFANKDLGIRSKVDLNKLVYENKIDMAVSNIVNCKDLGIVYVGNQYYIGAVNNEAGISSRFNSFYVYGAQALTGIGWLLN